MSTSKSGSKKAEKTVQGSTDNEGAKNDATNDKTHHSHKVNLTWTQRAKLATKGELHVSKNVPINLFKVRNKNAASFSLELVKHLPFAKVISSSVREKEILIRDILPFYLFTLFQQTLFSYKKQTSLLHWFPLYNHNGFILPFGTIIQLS